MTRRSWFLSLLLVLAALFLSGCIGGTGPTVVDGAIAWISGFVTKSRGEPIANASVTLNQTGENSLTDSQGRFSLGTTYRGEGTLRAEAGSYLTLEWPVSISSSGVSNLRLRLVSMADYSDALFRQLTGATDTVGTWRWDFPTITYTVDYGGAWRPEFNAPLREALTQWSMLARRAVTFVETPTGGALQVSYVSSSPCGVAQAAGCAGVTLVTPQGGVRGAFVELHAGYATDVGLNLHEIGHTLSFTGHSPNPSDVMYYAMNFVTTPSNQEAAVDSVLYSNPPGTTMQTIRLPSAQMPETAVTAPVMVAAAPPAPDLYLTPAAIPGLEAVEDVAAMIRAWLGGGSGCVINLPLFCGSGPAFRIW